MISPTSSSATFLFTDIEGSTRRWEQQREAMSGALARHDAILRAACVQANGQVFKTVGDAFCVAFTRPADALTAAIAAQRTLAAEDWSAFGAGFTDLRIRMAIHCGATEQRDGDFFGPAVNRVARLLAAAHGGQVLVSGPVAALLEADLPADVDLRDLGERRLKDLRGPLRVFQVTTTGLASTFPPLRTLDARPHNLPLQVNRFIGREAELEALRRMLRLGTSRLVTLTGPGGSGKTRLALQAAVDLVDDLDHGVWLVELGAVMDPDLVPQTLGKALRLNEAGDREIIDTICEHLRERELVVILDTCEHLLVACARLAARLATSCEGVRVLATSREPLCVPGEAVWPVPPLPTPAPQETRLEQIAGSEAVQLFVERATAAAPAFTLTSANAMAIAELCVHLDGIPLAIELAAARARALSVTQIAARLGSRFQLLTGGNRAAMPRQQTLLATLEWSYDLLLPVERRVFERLGVLAGSFELGAVEAVCRDMPLDAQGVQEALFALVDKSLVVASVTAVPARYRLLETISRYALERLVEQGDEAPVRDLHLAYIHAMCAEAEAALTGPDEVAWLNRLEHQHDNLRAALEWALVDEARVPILVDLAGCLWRFFSGHGHFREGRQWLARAAAAGHAARRDRCGISIGRLASVHYGLALMLSRLGDLDGAEREGHLALSEYQAVGDRLGEAWVYNDLYRIAVLREDLDTAERMLLTSIAIKREVAAPWDLAFGIGNLGELARNRGDLDRAARLYAEAIDLHGMSDSPKRINVMNNFGFVLVQTGDVETGRRWLIDGASRSLDIGNPAWLGNGLAGLGGAAIEADDLVLGARLLGAAQRVHDEIGYQRARTETREIAGWIEKGCARLGADAWRAAWEAGYAMSPDAALADAIDNAEP